MWHVSLSTPTLYTCMETCKPCERSMVHLMCIGACIVVRHMYGSLGSSLASRWIKHGWSIILGISVTHTYHADVKTTERGRTAIQAIEKFICCYMFIFLKNTPKHVAYWYTSDHLESSQHIKVGILIQNLEQDWRVIYLKCSLGTNWKRLLAS